MRPMKRRLTSCPERVVAAAVRVAEAEIALDALDGLGDAPVVEVDAVARDVADRKPVARLEMALGRARAFAKQRVVPVEARRAARRR